MLQVERRTLRRSRNRCLVAPVMTVSEPEVECTRSIKEEALLCYIRIRMRSNVLLFKTNVLRYYRIDKKDKYNRGEIILDDNKIEPLQS